MTDTVCLLLRLYILMAPDHMIQIIVHRCAGGYAGLHMFSHTELINVITRLQILAQISRVHQPPEKLSSFLIYLRTVHIGPFRKICFRTIHPQKRQGMFLNLFDCFFPGKDIIGKSRDLGRLYRLRADSRKWFYNCHKNLLSLRNFQLSKEPDRFQDPFMVSPYRICNRFCFFHLFQSFLKRCRFFHFYPIILQYGLCIRL